MLSSLSDGGIRRAIESGRLMIDPFDPKLIQPASIDFLMGESFRTFTNHRITSIDPRDKNVDELTELVTASEERPFILHPGEFALGSTLERVTLGDDLIARVEGKSSLGRLGLLIHSTAGFVDPGFEGHITLELFNVASIPIELRPFMPIGQLSFIDLDAPAERPYGHPDLNSKYQGQVGPTASRYFQNTL